MPFSVLMSVRRDVQVRPHGAHGMTVSRPFTVTNDADGNQFKWLHIGTSRHLYDEENQPQQGRVSVALKQHEQLHVPDAHPRSP
jgi:hypothetical protein